MINRLCILLGATFLLVDMNIAAESIQEPILSSKDLSDLERAERLFDSTAYPEAIFAYEALLHSTTHNEDLSLKLQLRIFQAYYLQEQYEKLIAFASTNNKFKENFLENRNLKKELLFLLATAYQRLGQYPESISFYQLHDQLGPTPESSFELGKTYYLQGDLLKAASYFLPIANSPYKDIQLHSLFYLVRIELAQGFPEKALNYLAKVADKDDEWHYLQGQTLLQLQNYVDAIYSFEKVVSKNSPKKETWYADTFYHLGQSYMKRAEEDSSNQLEHLTAAEEFFQKRLDHIPDAKSYLALLQCYLKMGALQKAEDLLTKEAICHSKEAYTQAVLLLAQTSPFYNTRAKYYQQLTQPENADNPDYVKWCYFQGLNHLNEANSPQSLQNAAKLRLLSTESFLHTWDLLEKAEIFNDELFYLKGLTASNLFHSTQQPNWCNQAEKAFMATFESFPKSKYAPLALHSLGLLLSKIQKNNNALECFNKLQQCYPESPLLGEALFLTAQCAEKLNLSRDIVKKNYERVYHEYPNSPLAPEAYFRYYTYYEYLQGDRKAIKHLQHFKDLFPQHALLMNAMYLTGLDFKRDRKTPEGKWVRKKDLLAAIDAFQEVEILFDHFEQSRTLTNEQLRHYLPMCYRANFERAQANLSIAQESVGAKKQIYLEYAIDDFKQIVSSLEEPTQLVSEELIKGEPFPEIYQESLFWMAKAHIEAQDDKSAERVLSKMLEKYKMSGITRGYYLARTWIELGLMAKRQHEPALALNYFTYAEDCSKGRVLSTDQMLDLWIQQGLCYRDLDQMDTAMLVLSKVINEDAISPLRLKAMFLRAEIYEMQGRYELARKQLDAMSKKGGEWALKAKEKLEKEYGT